MSGPDTPDYQRGGVAPGTLLATFAGTVLTGTVHPPSNTDVLWINSAQQGSFKPQVLAANSGISFPVFPVKYVGNGGVPGFYWVALVEIQQGQGITVVWTGRGAVGWQVFAQSGGRAVYDLAIAQASGFNGNPADETMLLVGGWDGTDYRILLTDATGALVVAGSTFPNVVGVPGAAPPPDALQVAGTDGALLRVPLLDGTGRVLSIDQNLALAIAARGAALPADALLAAGSDGANLRALLTDAAGHPLTIDQTIAALTQVIGSAHPGSVLQIGGQDGTNSRAFFTDAAGRLRTVDNGIASIVGAPTFAIPADAAMVAFTDGVSLRVPITSKSALPYMIPSAPSQLTGDRPPNDLLFTGGTAATDFNVIIGAPGAGKRIRIFYISIQSADVGAGVASAIFVYDNISIAHLAVSRAIQTAITVGQLYGYPSGIPLTTNAGVEITNNASGVAYDFAVTYTIETI